MIHSSATPVCSGKTRLLYAASVLIPFALWGLTLLVLGICPFGDQTLLISDANGQYLDFIALWKDVLTGKGSFFYTFTKTMGGDGLNLAAYYLLSPFNLLFLLVDNGDLSVMYTFVILLKTSLCGLTFYHFSAKRYGHGSSHLLFSTAYALMAYNVVYGWNLMWLDGVMILPLLALGLDRLLEGDSPVLYACTLAYALAVQFYIGYMLCIAAVLFCLARLFLMEAPGRLRCRRFGRFALTSCIAGFLAAPIWLPAFLSLAGERNSTNAFSFTLDRSFGLTSFPGKFLCGSTSPQDVLGGLPNVFCGTGVLLLAVIFFLCRCFSRKEKCAAGTLLAFLLLSFYFILPNSVWHGFSAANSFNYRYSFLFSFVLIRIGQGAYQKQRAISSATVILSGGITALFLLAALVFRSGFVSTAGAFISIAALVMAVLGLMSAKRRCRLAAALLFLAFLGEAGLNCTLSWNALLTEDWSLNLQEYRLFQSSAQAAADCVKEQDDGIYRMEKTFYRTKNDAALLGYRGLSHFSSTEPLFTKAFARSMGLPTEYDYSAAYTTGSTPEADSLLGVKYLLSREELSGKKDYTLIDTVEGIRIYRNENALPLALLCQEDALFLSPGEEDPFLWQEELWQSLCGDALQSFHACSYSMTAENLQPQQQEDGSLLYTRVDPPEDACLRFEVTVSRELPLYCYFSAPDMQRCELYVNGEYAGLYFDEYSWNITALGTFSPGETVVVELRPQEDSLFVTTPYFYLEDPAVLAERATALKNTAPLLERHDDSLFSGTFTCEEEQLLLFTIPWSDGWSLTVDGVPVETQRALGTFLATPVTAGTHSYTLSYRSSGWNAGWMLFSLSVLTMLGWYGLSRRKRM